MHDSWSRLKDLGKSFRNQIGAGQIGLQLQHELFISVAMLMSLFVSSTPPKAHTNLCHKYPL
jgi:hypothetical protein